ncbi:MAG: PAS domain S-box protein, partial [Chromatocurvus sp.]
MNQTHENPGVEKLEVFELAFNAMHSGLILYNRDSNSAPSGFRISAINDAGLGIARLSSADDAVGKDLVNLLPRAEAAGVVDLVAKVCESGATEHVPTLRYHDAVRGGTYRNSLYRIKPGVVLSVFDDITGEMSNLQRLDESEKRLNLLTDSIPDGIFDLDFASDVVYLSPGWKSQLGYAEHELPNALSTWSERLHPDERDSQLQAFEDFVRSTDSVWDTEFRLRHRNGHYVWLHSRATALRDPANGQIQRLIGFHVNTDAMRREQHEARERLELIETISRVIPDLLFLLSLDGEVLEHYAPDTALLYCDPEYFPGKNIADFMPGRVVDKHDAAVEESLRSHSVAQFQYELEVSAEKKCFESRLRVMPDGQRVAVVVRDITRERAVELKLEAHRRELEIFERVVAATGDCMALVSTDMCFRMVNSAFASYLGMTPESLRGKPVCDVSPALFAGESADRLKRAMSGDDVHFSHWQDGPEGRRLFSFTFSPFYEGNILSGVIITGHDITQLHAAQAEIRRAAQVFSSASEAIFTTDLAGCITDINPALLEITGYSREQLIGKVAITLVSDRHTREFFTDVMNRVESGERWRGEVWNKRADGSVYPCQMTISQVYEENGSGDLQGYVGVFFDTTTQKQYQQRLELVANHDPLTGLPNRAQFWRVMERTIELSRRTSATFSVMFIDLDHFKEVNDTLGHAAGDELLCKVTQRLNGLLRANDILARVGGEEFVVLLPSATNNKSASIVAEKIQQALLEPFSVAGAELNIGVSIGICAYPDDGDTVDLLLT